MRRRPPSRRAQLAAVLERVHPEATLQRANLPAMQARLLLPIDRIFEQQLQPRLERMPTRAQRAAAGQTTGAAP